MYAHDSRAQQSREETNERRIPDLWVSAEDNKFGVQFPGMTRLVFVSVLFVVWNHVMTVSRVDLRCG